MIKSIEAIKYNLSLLNERNYKVNTALSTKEALEYGSDDSIQYSHIVSLKGDINTYSSIKDNITLSNAFNTTSDDTLKSSKNTIDAIISELMTANTDTTSDEDRLIIATQMEDYRDTLLSLSNTQVDGKYIFSGINTDTPSFIQDSATGQISYQSDNSSKTLIVEKATYAKQGVNGIDAFYYDKESVPSTGSFTFSSNEIILDEDGNEWKLMDVDNDNIFDGLYLNGDSSSTPLSIIDNGDGTFSSTNGTSSKLEVKHSIFDDLNEVIAALKLEDLNGNTILRSDAKTILSDNLSNMKKAYDSQNIAHSIVGSRTASINNYEDIVSSKLSNLNLLKDEYSQADLTSLAIESKALENTYTALYSTISRINNLSLVNYLN